MAQTDTTANEKLNKATKLVNRAIAEKYEEVKDRAANNYDDAKNRVLELTERANEAIHDSIETTRSEIQKRPFNYLAGAAATGLLVGYLFGRRRS